MYIGDYNTDSPDNPGDGTGYFLPEENITSPGKYPGMLPYPGLTPEKVDEQMKAAAEGLLIPTFQSTLGRAPTPDELQQAHVVYRNGGGDIFRTWVNGLKASGTTTGSEGGGSETGGGGASKDPYFTYPDWVPPSWDVGPFKPTARTYSDFAYPEFQGPTSENFQTDPGYEFRKKETERSLINNASANGRAGGGDTLRALMSVGGNLASQEFKNVFDRQFGVWGANRNNAFDSWKANNDLSGERLHDEERKYGIDYSGEADKWLRSRDVYSTNLGKEAQTRGLSLNEQQGQFGNLLSLFQLMTRNLPSYTAGSGA